MTASETVVRVTPASVAAAPTYRVSRRLICQGGTHHGVQPWDDTIGFPTNIKDRHVWMGKFDPLHRQSYNSAKTRSNRQGRDEYTG